jgi:hypothetical protein
MRKKTLYQNALKLEGNKELRKEIQEWDKVFFNDGLDHILVEVMFI